MKTADLLFRLIKSLSPAEKVYFKKYATMDGTKQKAFVQLFDLLNDMKSSDEKLLQQKAKKLGIDKNLSKTKDYLYDSILDALVLLEQNHKPEFQAQFHLMKARILQEKKFIKESIEHAEEAQALADPGNHFGLSFHGIHLAANMYHLTMGNAFYEHFSQNIQPKLEELKNDIQSQIAIMNIFQRNQIYLNTLSSINNDAQAEVVRADTGPWFEKIHSRNKMLLAYSTALKGVFNFLTNNKIEEFRCKRDAWEMVKNEPEILKNFADICIIFLYNIIHLSRSSRQFYLTERLLKDYDDFMASYGKHLHTGLSVALTVEYFVRFNYNINRHLWRECEVMIPAFVGWIESGTGVGLHMKQRAQSVLLHYYFMRGENQKALLFINDWLQEEGAKVLKIKSMAWILFLLIHLEEKNFDLLQRNFVTAIKYFRKTGHTNRRIELFIAMFKALIKDPSLLQSVEFFKQQNEAMFHPDEKEVHDFEDFKIKCWIMSKINRSSYLEEYSKMTASENTVFKEKLIEASVISRESTVLAAGMN